MGLKRNAIQGWATTIVGLITMGITLYLIFTGQMVFMWNGVLGLSIGSILVMAPRTIEKLAMAAIKKVGFASSKEDCSTTPDNPDK